MQRGEQTALLQGLPDAISDTIREEMQCELVEDEAGRTPG
jgi:hypothetical protein